MCKAFGCGPGLRRGGLRPGGRGASLPASPCSFVAGHHVFGAGWAFARLDVVLPSLQTLIPSSTGTTSPGSDGTTVGWTWCFPPRKPLFFRRQASRLWGRRRRRRAGRGASRPAIPCSFVAGHHVFGSGWAGDRPGVVLRSPLALVPLSLGTTSSRSDGTTAASHPKSDVGSLVFLLHASIPFSKLMQEQPFFHLMHHSNHFSATLILLLFHLSEKVMQEPHFRTFLHHFSPIPGKRLELEGRAPPEAEPSRSIHPACGGSCTHGRTEFGPRSHEKRSTKGAAALRASLPLIIIPERKELTTNTPSSPFRRQF